MSLHVLACPHMFLYVPTCLNMSPHVLISQPAETGPSRGASAGGDHSRDADDSRGGGDSTRGAEEVQSRQAAGVNGRSDGDSRRVGGGAGAREASGGRQEGGSVEETQRQENAGRALYRGRLDMLINKWGLAPNACGWLLMRLLRPEQSTIPAVTLSKVAHAEDEAQRATCVVEFLFVMCVCLLFEVLSLLVHTR